MKLFAAFDAVDQRGTRARWSDSARRLRLATSGSAALPVTLGERWARHLGGVPKSSAMTEVDVGMSNPLAGPRKPGMVGHPARDGGDVLLKSTAAVETRQRAARSGSAASSVFAGYWKREEATAAAFVSGTVAAGERRWFKTGDTVTRDADGYFKIPSAARASISRKSGGYKLSALGIEEVLCEHASAARGGGGGRPRRDVGRARRRVRRPARGVRPRGGGARAFAKKKVGELQGVEGEVVGRTGSLLRNAVGKVVKPVS